MTPPLPPQLRGLLNVTATVYAADANGAHTVVAHSGLRCQLSGITLSNRAATAPDRQELAGVRILLWEPDVTVSEDAQVEIRGERWNIAGPIAEAIDENGQRAYWKADCVRAVS